MARVPDLGSDFAQKLLLDLRRRRERLGFDSPAPPQRTSSSSSNAAALPRDSDSSSQRLHRSQKPQQGAPRVGRAEAAANRSHQQSGNAIAIARAGKPRHRATPTANSHQIVPFQGGGGGGSAKQKPANSSIDVQMALALALSNRGKLQNIELVSRNSSIFFRDTDHLVSPGAHVGKVAIGVQKLNDILMAYSSGSGGARDTGRRSSVDIGGELFRGAMDLEESLSMLVMLQEASDYMEGSGNGKVLLLEGKENRKNPARSPSSARLVEIVDEDSETEKPKNAKSLSMQIVPHKNSQGFSPNSSSVLQLSTVTGNNSRSNVSKGDKDDAKVRMPNVIAKLMGLDNLPSTKEANKGMEKFVKPEALSRKDRRANAVGGRLPIQIIGSERVSSKGHNMNLLPGEWKIGLKNYEVYRSANFQVSNSSSIPVVDKQTRQTMRQMLSKMENTERRGSLAQAMQEDRKLTEETNQRKVVNVGCRTDAGNKMDFLKRIRKISGSRQVTEEKHIVQEKNTTSGKKQTTSMKQLLGTDSEDKSKRTRVKFNKENLAATEIKNAGRGKNRKTDQSKRQSYNKQTDVHSLSKKSQNCREIKSTEGIQNLEHKKSTKLEATQVKILPYTAEMQQESGKRGEENDIIKPSDSHGDGGISEQCTGMVDDSRTTGMASPDQFMKQITEVTTIDVQASDRSNVVDQSVTQTNDDTTSNTASETTQIPETFTEEEQHQNLQLVEFEEQPMDDLQDQKMHVVSCDSFTENQLLLMKMLLEDQYLLETAKALVRNPVPVHFVNASADKWSEKGSSLFSDIAREVIRKKGKRTEAIVEVSMANSTTNMKLQYLDDLIMVLDGDIESLNISKKSQQHGEDCTAENLRMIVQSDMQNNHPDANSMWDFGWNRISDLPIERNEVIRDLEKNILGGMITDVARELIELSVRHGCCACQPVRPE
uniref:DUF3741 domain-containing protein n=1 Tax=Oryza punctata TaxID=4537 RepID=A0A0E0KJM2_ORYPU